MASKSIATVVALTGFLVLGSGTALAYQGDPAPGAATEGEAAPSAEDLSRRVCRTVIPSGSRLGHRVCRTRGEWDRARETTQRFVRDGQTNGYRRDGEFSGMGQLGPR